MGSEWKRVCVADVCELIVDCVNKTAPVVDYPTPFKMIRTPNVKSGRVTTNDCRFVTEEVFDKWTRRAQVRWGDVLLTREAPLGEVGIVKTHENIFLGQRLMQYRANPKLLDADFLLYSFLSSDLQNQFSMHEGSGSVVSHIRVGDCLKFEINLPSLEEQKRIAHVLSSVDEKITLNRQLNQTLEHMAQALFKSWFVDFDPVIDNALAAGNAIPDDLQDRSERRQLQLAKADHKPLPENIRKLFPSEFELTESLGWVPKGWGITDVKSLSIKISKGTTPTKSDLEKATDVGAIPFLKVKDISSDGKILHGGLELIPKSISEGALKRSILEKDDLLISIAGSIGRTSVVQKDLHGCNCNQALAFIRLSDSDLHLQLVKLNIQGKRLQDEINSKIVQAVQANFSLTQLGELKILMSSGEVLHSFNALLKPIQLRLNEIEIQSRNLEQLRDTLLPKLISGELRIPEVQAQLGEALG